MRSIRSFESFSDEEKRELRPRPVRKPKESVKRCIGECQRKLYLKDGKPVIYCPSCDRIINQN